MNNNLKALKICFGLLLNMQQKITIWQYSQFHQVCFVNLIFNFHACMVIYCIITQLF